MPLLSDVRAVLFDLDGTLYVGDSPVGGALEAVNALRQRGVQLRFLTNTTTKSQAQLLARLLDLGFAVASDEILSAPSAARLELAAIEARESRSVRIWPLVADAIKPDFFEFEWDETRPDYVVLGDIGEQWDLGLINKLFNVIHGGAELIALHKNRFWQTSTGLKADIGFFVAGLEYVCSKPALVMGKPNRDFFSRVLVSAGVSAQQALMVGDDIDSDIGGAQALGINGALVQTGKYRRHYHEQSMVQPHLVIASVADLPRYF